MGAVVDKICEKIYTPETPSRKKMRPTSAKATKHKRVADSHERPTVYEDCEESEPDVDDETDGIEADPPSTKSIGPVGCMLSMPPKLELITAAEQVTPPKPLLEAWPRPSPGPVSNRHMEQSSSPLRRDWSVSGCPVDSESKQEMLSEQFEK